MKQDFLYSYQYDFPEYSRFPEKVFALFFVPRSGSTLLSCLLAQTQALGFPLEYFARPNFSLLMTRLPGLSIFNLGPLYRVRTSPNGLFGYKWNSDFENDSELAGIRRNIKPDRIILIDRDDKFLQAQSFAIAEKTQQWVLPKAGPKDRPLRCMVDGVEIERAQAILLEKKIGFTR